jgi:integrase
MPRSRADGTPARRPRRFNLSQRRVDRIRAEPLPFTVWDKRTPGLCVRVHPSGRKAWKVVYRKHGRPEWLHVGDAGTISHTDARRIAARVAVQVFEGRDPVAERRAQRAGTFAEVAERYFNEHARRRNKSWAQADRLTRRYLLPRWGRLSPASISRSDVRAMLASIAAPILCNQVRATCSAIFNWCVGMEIITVNPCVGVKRNPTRSRARILSDDEIKRFWAAFDVVGLLRTSALRLVLLTGQRGGEVTHLLRQHIVGDWWEMPGQVDASCGWPGTKNYCDHRVFLSQPVQRIIAELSNGEASGFVLGDERGRPIDGLDHAMREICRTIGAERATPHDLRRTFASTLARLGRDRVLMDKILNHKDGSVGGVYDRYHREPEMRRAMERVAAHVLALVNNGQAVDNVVELRS